MDKAPVPPPEFKPYAKQYAHVWWTQNDVPPDHIVAQSNLRRRKQAHLRKVLWELKAYWEALRERICTKFADDWDLFREGKLQTPPSIHQVWLHHCETAIPAKRCRLLKELLTRDIQARRGLGQSPSKSDYLKLFPKQANLVEVIDQTFQELFPSFANRYRFDRKVGKRDPASADPEAKGGQGEIYIGYDGKLNRDVLIKRSRHAGDTAEIQLTREAHTLAQLTGVGVPVVYEFGPDAENHYCIAEELITGLPEECEERVPLADRFSDRIRQFHAGDRTAANRRNPHFLDLLSKVIAYSRTVAAAHRHDYGILHRDLKPDNLLVDGNGVAFVIDWGLAAWMNRKKAAIVFPDAPKVGEGHTLRSVCGGTPGYLSPEQTNTKTKPDRTCDVFGLGACLFELLTNRRVYDCVNPWWLLCRTIVSPVNGDDREVVGQTLWRRAEKYLCAPNPRAVRSRIDRELADITRKAIARQPRNRFQDAGELVESLEDWMRDNAPRRPCGSWLRRRRYALGRWTRHNTGRFVLVTLVLSLLLALGAVGWVGFAFYRHQTARDAHTRLADYVDVVETTPAPGLGVSRRTEHVAKARAYLKSFVSAAGESRSILDRFFGGDFTLRVAEARLKVAELCHANAYFAEATDILNAGIEELKPLDRPDVQEPLARMYWKLGDIESDLEQYDKAIASYSRAAELQAARLRQLEGDPAVDCKATLARTLGYHGDSYTKRAELRLHDPKDRTESNAALARSDFDLARKDYDESLELRKKVLEARQNDGDANAALAHAHNNLARWWRYQKECNYPVDLQPILEHNLRAVGLQGKLVLDPTQVDSQNRSRQWTARADCGDTLIDLADSLVLFGEYESANAIYSWAWAIHSSVHSENPRVDSSLALIRIQIGMLKAQRYSTTSDDRALGQLFKEVRDRFANLRNSGVDDHYLKKHERALDELKPGQ